MGHLHALESKNAQFFELEHVLDVLKIEYDIMDVMPFKSEYLWIIFCIYTFEPKSTCPLIPIYASSACNLEDPILPSPIESLYRTETL